MIRFTKMHGLGNDIVIIDNRSQRLPQTLPITIWSDRKNHVGFDQLIIVEPSTQADAFCRIFNADGSEAKQCGNGLRCVARFLYATNQKTTFTLATQSGCYPIMMHDDQCITVQLDVPKIQPHNQTATIPLQPYFITLGNDHAIINVPTLTSLEMQTLYAIATSLQQTRAVNVGFMEIVNPHTIKLRTFEKGVGETAACGSNACAAVAIGITQKWLVNDVNVQFALGVLQVAWPSPLQPMLMRGSAHFLFEGSF